MVEQYLENECAPGRVLGPFPGYLLGLHTSHVGVIPKKSQPGKWRLIIDLSTPQGFSINDGINDGINAEVCSLRYPSVDTVANLMIANGPGSYLSKLDIKEAYSIVWPKFWPFKKTQFRRPWG